MLKLEHSNVFNGGHCRVCGARPGWTPKAGGCKEGERPCFDILFCMDWQDKPKKLLLCEDCLTKLSQLITPALAELAEEYRVRARRQAAPK